MSMSSQPSPGRIRSGPGDVFAVVGLEIVEDQHPLLVIHLGHALFLDHPVQRLVPMRARQALLADQAEGVAGVAEVEGLLLARPLRQAGQ